MSDHYVIPLVHHTEYLGRLSKSFLSFPLVLCLLSASWFSYLVSILVIDWCVTTYPKTSGLKHLLSYSSCESGYGLTGSVVQGLSQGCNQGIGQCHFKTWLGKDLLLSSLIWLLAGFSSLQDIGQSHHFLVLWACSRIIDHSVSACFIRVSKQEAPERERTNKMKVTVLSNLISEETFHHFCHILLIKSKSLGPAHT